MPVTFELYYCATALEYTPVVVKYTRPRISRVDIAGRTVDLTRPERPAYVPVFVPSDGSRQPAAIFGRNFYGQTVAAAGDTDLSNRLGYFGTLLTGFLPARSAAGDRLMISMFNRYPVGPIPQQPKGCVVDAEVLACYIALSVIDVSPASGAAAGGILATVKFTTGCGAFVPSDTPLAVLFGDQPAGECRIASRDLQGDVTIIVCRVPPGEGVCDVTVNFDAVRATKSAAFTYQESFVRGFAETR